MPMVRRRSQLGQSYAGAPGTPIYNWYEYEITGGYGAKIPQGSTVPDVSGNCAPGYSLLSAMYVENAGDAGLRYWPVMVCAPVPGYSYTPAPPPPIPTAVQPAPAPAPVAPVPVAPAPAPLPTVPRDALNPYAPPQPAPITSTAGSGDPVEYGGPLPVSGGALPGEPAKTPWGLIAAAAAALLLGQ
jgi:hypothetical protein